MKENSQNFLKMRDMIFNRNKNAPCTFPVIDLHKTLRFQNDKFMVAINNANLSNMKIDNMNTLIESDRFFLSMIIWDQLITPSRAEQYIPIRVLLQL